VKHLFFSYCFEYLHHDLGERRLKDYVRHVMKGEHNRLKKLYVKGGQ